MPHTREDITMPMRELLADIDAMDSYLRRAAVAAVTIAREECLYIGDAVEVAMARTAKHGAPVGPVPTDDERDAIYREIQVLRTVREMLPPPTVAPMADETRAAVADAPHDGRAALARVAATAHILREHGPDARVTPPREIQDSPSIDRVRYPADTRRIGH